MMGQLIIEEPDDEQREQHVLDTRHLQCILFAPSDQNSVFAMLHMLHFEAF